MEVVVDLVDVILAENIINAKTKSLLSNMWGLVNSFLNEQAEKQKGNEKEIVSLQKSVNVLEKRIRKRDIKL